MIERAFQRSKSIHAKRLSNKTKHLEQKQIKSNPTKAGDCLDTMVTDLTGTLDKDEITLLVKGPQFALTQRVDELEIIANFSQLAYQLRWQRM